MKKTQSKKKSSKSIIESPKLLTEKEQQNLINTEKRNSRLKKIFTGLLSLLFGSFFLFWGGAIIYDYIQTSNHQAPIFCLSREVRSCQSEDNKGTIVTCHGLGYKSIIPSKQCANIKTNKTFFGLNWAEDPFIKSK